MTGRSQRRGVSAFQISIGGVSVALSGEGLSEISLVNSSFQRAAALLLISYCTHLSIKGPWRVCPTRTTAPRNIHTQRERGGRQSEDEGRKEMDRDVEQA